MKKLLLGLLALVPFVLTGCEDDHHLYATAEITQKYDYVYTQVISTGKTTIVTQHHKYLFIFNEVKPYRKSVEEATYNEYEVGDVYTFWIDEQEREYFFPTSISTVKPEEEED